MIALSSHSDSRYVSAMLEAGACGYVLKANAYADLRRALEAARQGKSYLCPEVTQAVVDASLHGRGSAVDAARTLPSGERAGGAAAPGRRA